MGTLQTEFQRVNLVKSEKETKEFGTLDKMLISQQINENISRTNHGINKCIKEKYPLFKNCQKHSKVRILYQTKKEGEIKMVKMDNQRLEFIRILVGHLIGQELHRNNMLEIMKGVSCGKGTHENAISNFLNILRWTLPEIVIRPRKGYYKIDSNITVEQFVALYLQSIPRYWKHFAKPVSKTPKTKTRQAPPPTKQIQMNVQLADILNFLKENGININVEGAVGVNVKVNVEFSIKR
jgi:hypothetical protein